MNDYIIEPAKIEDYESILELYNELHEVLEECNPQKFRKIEKTEILITKEYFEKALNHEVNTNFEVYKINGKTIGVVEYAVWDAYQNPGFIPCIVCVIGNIVVKKEYRNQGIGTHLFEYIKNKNKLSILNKMLNNINNSNNISFFSKLNYNCSLKILFK